MRCRGSNRAAGHFWLANIALAAAYFATAKLGLSLAFLSSSVTAVWPPTGIALVALYVGGYRMIPGVALGALVANATTGDLQPASVVTIAAGNTLEALVGTFLLRRAGFDPALERPRDVVMLTVLAGVFSTAVAATVGTSSLLVGSAIDSTSYGPVWRTWWLGDMGGALLVAPALFVAVCNKRIRELPGRPVEAVVVAAALLVISIGVFSVKAPLLYLVFPGLAWAALRYWQHGAAAASLTVAGVAVALTAGDHGPFARGDEDASLLLAQTFVSVAGVTAYLIAALATERRQVERSVEEVAEALQNSLLPRALPSIPGVQAAAYFRPLGLKTQVGGDFYDIFDLGGDRWGVVMGDVCGKGPRAAGVTGLARHTLRTAARFELAPSRWLALLNAAVREALAGEDFCTASCARIDLREDGSAGLTVANGGHPLPLVLHANGTVESAGLPGTLLGMLDRPSLQDVDMTLEPGDTLVLYTDGLAEAYAPRQLVEVEDIARELGRCIGASPTEILESLAAAFVADGVGTPRDDIAMLALRVRPS